MPVQVIMGTRGKDTSADESIKEVVRWVFRNGGAADKTLANIEYVLVGTIDAMFVGGPIKDEVDAEITIKVRAFVGGKKPCPASTQRKGKAVQCKDIPDEPILRFLFSLRGEWANWYFDNERDVHRAMPPGTPDKVVHAKMRKLIARGLVDGCDCGCRGDFVLTDKGREAIGCPEYT